MSRDSGRRKRKFESRDDGGVINRKIEAVLASNMPEDQKSAYIEQIARTDEAIVNRVSFAVYARIKGIRKSLQSGMVAFPKAQGVALASLEEWDEIYKSF